MTALNPCRKLLVTAAVLLLLIILSATVVFGALQQSKGQTIYVSVIPQIQRGPRLTNTYLGLLLIVRNTDMSRSVTIQSIGYYNASGDLEKTVLAEPMTLPPLASHSFPFEKEKLAIPEGMSGCMILKWDAKKRVNPLLVDGIVVGSGTGWSSGMVFKGIVLEEKK